MRPNNQNNKNRQRGRNGGRKHVNPLSRNFESNGPDVKVRGNAAHIAEKYLQLARDAQSSGDSVMAENYLQHAEHYFRIVSSAQQAQNGQRPEGQDDDFDDDMPDMNSRFASPIPQPQQQPQYQPAEGEEQPEGGEQPRQQGEQRAEGEQGNRERPSRGDRRDRNRNRDRFRPEGEVQQSQPIVAAEQEQPAVAEAAEAAAAPVEAEGEEKAAKPRERRPRRRRPAAGEDLANADQPDVGGLPAFLTGGASNAAE